MNLDTLGPIDRSQVMLLREFLAQLHVDAERLGFEQAADNAYAALCERFTATSW
ncbi:hypothetical protein [Corynebacterium sp. c7Ub_26]